MDDTDLADTVVRRRASHQPTVIRADLLHPSILRSEVDADTVLRSPGGRNRAVDEAPDETPDETSPDAQYPRLLPIGNRISINRGEPIAVTVPHLIGRNPREPRVVSGDRPQLVIVTSARGEVSATHLEISQVGSSIVVTDLRSTNGTVVTMPGSAPTTMRSGESLVAVAGTVIDIGDGNMIEVLPQPRLRPWDGQEPSR